jgi:hypothetical protein
VARSFALVGGPLSAMTSRRKAVPQNEETTERGLTVFGIRKADLAGIAKNRPFHKISFADAGYIAGGASEFSGSARDVNGIGNDGKEGIGERNGGCDGGANGDDISGFRHPMMLHVE